MVRIDGRFYRIIKDETRWDLVKSAFKLFWVELTRQPQTIFENSERPWEKIIVENGHRKNNGLSV